MEGLIYILSNEGMRNFYKIGETKRTIEARMKELYNTSVPYPFEIEFLMKVENSCYVETLLHRYWDKKRTPNREFFKFNKKDLDATKEMCITVFKGEVLDSDMIEIEDPNAKANNEDLNEEYSDDNNKEIRVKGDFNMLNIPVGSELIFKKDNSIKCIVAGENKVEFGKELFSLTSLARKFLQEKFHWKTGNINGFRFFIYENESLWDRRLRLESEAEDCRL